MKIWDIIDKTQPGVEITCLNERRVKFAGSGAKLISFTAGILLATTSAFCMPIPRQTFITSVSASESVADVLIKAPPLQDFFASTGDGFSNAEEASMLSKLDGISFQAWSHSDEDVHRAIATNMSEKPTARSTAEVAKILKRHKFA